MELPEIKTKIKLGTEKFCFQNNDLNFDISDFWRWNQSDLIENRTRGILAEFLVKKALGISNEARIEWDAYDLITETGIKIEIKSASYIQSWEQQEYSNIKFNIRRTVDYENSENVLRRQSDYYVFCLLKTKNQKILNPMDLAQWDFYVLKTEILNEKVGNQKTIGLNPLLKLNPKKCTFSELKNAIN